MLDNEAAARQLTRHLIQHGHRRIGAIMPDRTMTSGRERFAGFTRALQEAGLAPHPSLVREGRGVEHLGFEAALAMLDLAARPTALFCGNNMITVGALKAIRERGLRIPEDMPIVGHDELPWMSLLAAGITVAAQPIHEMGHRAVALLMARIAGDAHPPREEKLQSRLIVRRSVLSVASNPTSEHWRAGVAVEA